MHRHVQPYLLFPNTWPAALPPMICIWEILQCQEWWQWYTEQSLSHPLPHPCGHFCHDEVRALLVAHICAFVHFQIAGMLIDLFIYMWRNRCDEKNMDRFLSDGRDKWVASAYEIGHMFLSCSLFTFTILKHTCVMCRGFPQKQNLSMHSQ